MIPPSLNDFGKTARDLLTKNFHFGHVKFEARSSVNPALEFTVSGTSHTDSGKVSSFLESKYKVPERRLTFTEKWTTENVLNLVVSVEDSLLKGLKVDFETGYEPNSQKKQAKIKSSLKREHVNANLDLEFEPNGPTAAVSCALGHSGYLAGGLIGFELARGKLYRTQFAFGYQNEDFSLSGSLVNGSEIHVLAHHRVCDSVEIAGQVSGVRQLNAVRLCGAAKYLLTTDSFVKASINNQSQLGLAYSHLLRPGLRSTVCALVDLKRFSQPNTHVFGIAFEVDLVSH